MNHLRTWLCIAAAAIAAGLTACGGSSGPQPQLALVAGKAGDFGTVDGPGPDARFIWLPLAALDSKTGDVFVMTSLSAGRGDAIRRVSASGNVTTEPLPTVPPTVSFLAGYAYDADRQAHYVGSNGACGYTSTVGCTPGLAIWRLSPGGAWTEFAGKTDVPGTADGAGSDARFTGPLAGPVIDAAGNIYVGDANRLRKITPDGVVSTLVESVVSAANADAGTQAVMLAVSREGTVYVLSSDAVLRKVSPSGAVTEVAGQHNAAGYVDGTAAAARLRVDPSPYVGVRRQMSIASDGSVYLPSVAGAPGEYPPPGFTQEAGGTIRKVAPDGTVSTVAGQLGHNELTLGPAPGSFTAPNWVIATGDALLFNTSIVVLKMSPRP